MVEDEKDRQLDAMLDSLLSGYSAVEPRPGLEIRIRAGLKAHARQRRRQWALVFAASAAMVIAAALIARTRTPHEVVPNHVAGEKSAPAPPAPGPPQTAASAPQRAPRPAHVEHHAKVSDSPDSRILLQALNALPQADNTVFVHERLYLSPATQPEPEPAREERASAPNISIQHLGVRPIEIKDISSAKDMN